MRSLSRTGILTLGLAIGALFMLHCGGGDHHTASGHGTICCVDVCYDNTASGLMGTEAQAVIDELAGLVATLQSEVAALQAADTALDSRVTTAEGTIGTLDTRATALEAADVAMDTRLTTAEGTITTLDSRVTTLEAADVALDARVTAAEGSITSMDTRLTTAEGTVTAMDARLTTAEGTITTLDLRVATIESDYAFASHTHSELQYMSLQTGAINGLAGPHVVFSGANVHIRSGSGATDDGGVLTGLGNLVVGYNEDPSVPIVGYRDGSHNLVIGQEHTYTSYAGVVAGLANFVTAPTAAAIAGQANTASGARAFVSGGMLNTASGMGASVTGGQANTASAQDASVTGGETNTASNLWSTVSGGSNRSATGPRDWVAGSLFEDL